MRASMYITLANPRLPSGLEALLSPGRLYLAPAASDWATLNDLYGYKNPMGAAPSTSSQKRRKRR